MKYLSGLTLMIYIYIHVINKNSIYEYIIEDNNHIFLSMIHVMKLYWHITEAEIVSLLYNCVLSTVPPLETDTLII